MTADWLEAGARYVEQWLEFQVRFCQVPGCVLSIRQDGTTVSERAFGVADLETGEPLTLRHRFRVASHSKTFTAVGILTLREAGLLRLDDRVGTHVSGLTEEVGAVTIAQLLTHSAGLMRDGTDSGHWQDRRPFLDETELRAQLSGPLTLGANTRFKYSNLAFGLLGLVIEAVTGEPFDAWIERTVVAAAGLAETTPDMPAPTADILMALGHSARLPLERRVIIPGDNPTHALDAATGFVSTAADLTRFFSQLAPAAPVSPLSVESRREMTRPHWRIPHLEQERSYGLGTVCDTIGDHPVFGHTGQFQGFTSRTAVVPGWGVAVSVVTNAVDGPASPWIEGILHILLHFARNGAPDPSLADWTGRWWSIFGVIDLVPMGRKVVVAAPALLMPFREASELAINNPTCGRIEVASGFGSHGEAARRVLGQDGQTLRLHLGGAELSSERDFAESLMRGHTPHGVQLSGHDASAPAGG